MNSTPYKLCSYCPEPRAEVCCFKHLIKSGLLDIVIGQLAVIGHL